MKTILIIFLFLPIASMAQVSLNFGVGGMKKVNTYPIFKLSAQVQLKDFVVEAAEYPGISRDIASGKYIGGSVGYNIYGFIPSAGYFYCIHSTDEKSKSMNGWHWKAGLKYQWMVNRRAGLFAEGFYMDKSSGFVAGISYNL